MKQPLTVTADVHEFMASEDTAEMREVLEVSSSLATKFRRLAANAQRENVFTRAWMKVAADWLTGTAYKAGNFVKNGANLYVAVSAGTSGATPPTHTNGGATTDGGVLWTYYGANWVTSDASGAPTYTTSTSASIASGLGNVYNPQAALGVAALQPRGCYFGANFSTDWVSGKTFTATSGATALGVFNAVEWMSDAPKLYFMVSSNNGPVSVVIDGVRFSLNGTDFNASNSFHVFDFAGVKKVRRWRLEGPQQALNISKVGVDSNSQVWKPSNEDDVTVALISDSLCAFSSFGPFFNGGSIGNRLCHELGWSDVWPFVQGGTGYINRGTGAGVTTDKYGYRVAEALTRSPDLWVLMGSTNDLDSNASDVTIEALAVLQAIRAGSSAPIIVFGIWSLDDSAKSAGHKVADIESAIQAAVTAFADGDTYFIPIRNDSLLPWVTGTWNNTSNTNSTNRVLYVSGDAVHPPDIGTAYLAQRMATAIRDQVLPLL